MRRLLKQALRPGAPTLCKWLLRLRSRASAPQLRAYVRAAHACAYCCAPSIAHAKCRVGLQFRGLLCCSLTGHAPHACHWLPLYPPATCHVSGCARPACAPECARHAQNTAFRITEHCHLSNTPCQDMKCSPSALGSCCPVEARAGATVRGRQARAGRGRVARARAPQTAARVLCLPLRLPLPQLHQHAWRLSEHDAFLGAAPAQTRLPLQLRPPPPQSPLRAWPLSEHGTFLCAAPAQTRLPLLLRPLPPQLPLRAWPLSERGPFLCAASAHTRPDLMLPLHCRRRCRCTHSCALSSTPLLGAAPAQTRAPPPPLPWQSRLLRDRGACADAAAAAGGGGGRRARRTAGCAHGRTTLHGSGGCRCKGGSRAGCMGAPYASARAAGPGSLGPHHLALPAADFLGASSHTRYC